MTARPSLPARLLSFSIREAIPHRPNPRRPYSLAVGIVAAFALAFAMIGMFL